MIVFWPCISNAQLRIGWMNKELPADEAEGITSFFASNPDLKGIPVDGPVKDISLLWMHSLSPDGFKAINKTAILNFVRNGGNLVLSMEAVPLLHTWGIEPNAFEIRTDSIRDQGFGRPLGFHGFLSHPVFDGLHGGVYPWKSPKDHVVRKIGFFGNKMPAGKVIGIEWTYITFHEHNKLLLEYKLGKGRIIAVGAFSYFGQDNLNKLQLYRFYENIFRYCASPGQTGHYWNYDTRKVIPLPDKLPAVRPPSASRWEIPALSISLRKERAEKDFVSLSGRRMLLMGKQQGGIEEIWTHPFMSFRDVETGVMLAGADTITWLSSLQPSITVSPEMIIREYDIHGTRLKEITTVSFDQPVAVVHYEWTGAAMQKLYMKYTSNFRYMWPYSDSVAATIAGKWSPEMNAAVATAQSGKLAGIVSFSATPEKQVLGQYTIAPGTATPAATDRIQLSGIFTFDASKANGELNAYFVAGSAGLPGTLQTYQQEAPGFNQLFLRSSAYYRTLLENSLFLETPDTLFNTGYRWALARADQFFQETPGIGTSLMAGFGTTARGWNGRQRISGRPGYAWYFGRDAQWSAMAINAYGGYGMVKKTLEVFVRFQDLDGKIYHELTSSGVAHYDASDATPLFVVLAAHYLRYSGDTAYIRDIWPAIQKAIAFCYATDTDGDGLIENTNVGHGWVEGGPLFGTHTEIYLAGCWSAALDAGAYIGTILGDTKETNRYWNDAIKVRQSIDRDFWIHDTKQFGYFSAGKMQDGSFMPEPSVLTGVPVYFGAVTDSAKAAATAASYASPAYMTDWGMRIIPNTSKQYNPRAYHNGMVWPLFGGYAALASYKTGFYNSGFGQIISNLAGYRHWSLGSLEETLNGDIYKPAGVCSQQCWSETMVLQPVTEGMLGLAPDAPGKTITIAPRFPWNWEKVTVRNISFGPHRLQLSWLKHGDTTTIRIQPTAGGTCAVQLIPALPPGTKVLAAYQDGRQIPFKQESRSQSEEIHLSLQALNAPAEIVLVHTGGIGALTPLRFPEPGDKSTGGRITQQTLDGNRMTIMLEGGDEQDIEVFSRYKISEVKNGRITNVKEDIYTIRAAPGEVILRW